MDTEETKTKLERPRARQCFISYAPEDVGLVADVQHFLSLNGVKPMSDQLDHARRGFLGLSEWMEVAMGESDKILILCTSSYASKSALPSGSSGAALDAGVRIQCSIMQRELRLNGRLNEKIICLTMTATAIGRQHHVPFPALHDFPFYEYPEDKQIIRALLYGQDPIKYEVADVPKEITITKDIRGPALAG